MRINRPFWIVGGAILITVLLWLAKERLTGTTHGGLSELTAEGLTAKETNETMLRRKAGAQTVPASPDSSSIASGVTNLVRSDRAQLLNTISNYNDVPIVFYGRLEDQFRRPVVGAAVEISVPFDNGTDAGTRHGEVVSDGKGEFTVSGYTGERLSVVPKKEGYALASTNGGGVYSRLWPEDEQAHSDRGNPVVIKMWKLQGGEPLMGINQQYRLPYTSAPVFFDLIAGKIVSTGGDVKMTVEKVPVDSTPGSAENCNVQIGAVGGGIMDSGGQERTTYWAPAEGYQAQSAFTIPPNGAGMSRGYFITSRDGQVFSKLYLSFRIDEQPGGLMYVTLQGIANTNGSRNWEGDPNTYKP